MTTILDVTVDDGRRLTAELLVELLRRLLHVEADRAGLLRSGIHVPARINVSDGGEDGRIEWDCGPECTAFLPGRLVQFQVKATDMGPAKVAAEVQDKAGAVKPEIAAVLHAGGGYIVFCNRDYDGKRLRDRVGRLREALAQGGVSVGDCERADFWDANKIIDWVNAHYPVALWVLEQVRAGGALPFLTWDRWASERDIRDFPFIQDGRIEPVAALIRERLIKPRAVLLKPRAVLRLLGLSGLGKSRLAFEALGRDIALRDQVVMARAAFGAERVLSVAQALREYGKAGVIVVDDCPFELHRQLCHIIEHANSSLSLLTIDYDMSGSKSDDVYVVPPAAREVSLGILQQAAYGISQLDAERFARMAQGFPQVAVLIAKAWPFDTRDIASLTDIGLANRMIFGRAGGDDELLKVARLLGAFGVVGVYENAEAELRCLADQFRLDVNAVYGHIQTLIDRRIVQRRGRYVQLQPQPLALSLAAEFWKRIPPRCAAELAFSLPARLKTELFEQMAKLDRVSHVRDLVDYLCHPGQPFSDRAFLGGRANARCFRYLCEINPGAAVCALESALAGLDTDALKRMEESCRELVWALEGLCFRAETFAQAVRLLERLALAEIEEGIGNNATGVFKGLFKLGLSGTQAPPEAKLQLLDEMLACNDPARRHLAVDALNQGLPHYRGFRTVGAEIQGSGPALKEWRPTTWGEVFAYHREFLVRLTDVACGDGELAVVARNYIGGALRTLFLHDLADEAADAVERVVAVHGAYWPRALTQIGEFLSYDAEGAPPEVRDKALALQRGLIPDDLASRLRLFVSELPYGFIGEARMDGEGPPEASRRRTEVLAQECLSRYEEFKRHLPSLVRGEQRNTYFFGQVIGAGVPEDLKILIDEIIGLLRLTPREEQNAAFLGGLLRAAEAIDPALVDRQLEVIAADPALAHFLPPLTTERRIEPADLARIIGALKDGRIAAAEVRILNCGSVLDRLPPEEIAPLVDALLDQGQEGLWMAVDVVGMYGYRHVERWSRLRPQIARLLQAFDVTASATANRGLDKHLFIDLALWLIRQDPAAADGQAATAHLVGQAVQAALHWRQVRDLDDVIKQLLPELLRLCPDVAWPVLSDGIVAHADQAWSFEHLLGATYSEGKSAAGPLLAVGEERLMAWCHQHPAVAPAFVARITPLFTNSTSEAADEPSIARTWHPVVLRLLDEFGDREDVLGALHSNMHDLIWWGSPVPYLEQYLQPLESLFRHPRPEVVSWARQRLQAMERQIKQERALDDEHDLGIW